RCRRADHVGTRRIAERRDSLEDRMEIRRELKLNQALETARVLLEHMQGSHITMNGRENTGDDLVELVIEVESSEDQFELELEIKWRARSEGQEHGEGQE